MQKPGIKSVIPFSHALTLFVLWTLITVFGIKFTTKGEEVTLLQLISKGFAFPVFIAGFVLVAYTLARNLRTVLGLYRPARLAHSILIYPLIAILCSLLASTYLGKFNNFSSYGWPLVNCLFVGISEELMFRGVLLSSLVRIYKFWRAAIILSLMFGMVHVLNGFITGLFFESFVQAILATFSGFIFLAIRVKTKSIVLAIAIHWLWDFSVFMSATNPHAGGKIIEMMVSIVLAASPLAFGILGIAQLRNRKVVEDFLAEQPESISY
jgi:membrane protease YdiL (CAAX protease family)